MNGAVISLTVAYALLGLLLLSLNLKSTWSWSIKAIAIITAVPLFVVTFVSLQALLGWPSASELPARFQLHAALVEEPSTGHDRTGAIFLWLTPAEDAEPEEAMADGAIPEVKLLPRAFVVPYSRELHERVEAMRKALQQGTFVAGRYEGGSPWARRFGQQNGGIDLYTPPPPPMPSKEG
ncbi:MAG: hypothetical protein ACR2QF_11720 [Geminicoccaceae bacterium]